MRRLIIIGCSLLAFVGAGSARVFADDGQSSGDSPRVRVGAFWSANWSNLAYDPKPIDVAPGQWLGAGAGLEIPFSDSLSLDTRAMWNRKGAKLTLSSNTLFQDVRADYLSIPVLFRVSGHGVVHGYAVAGPELGIRLRSRVITTLGATSVDENANSVTERTDFAIDGGVGLERDMGRSRLFVEALYSHGLRNIVTPAAGDVVHSRTLTLLAGLRF